MAFFVSFFTKNLPLKGKKKMIYSGALLPWTCISRYQRALIALIKHFSRMRGLQVKK